MQADSSVMASDVAAAVDGLSCMGCGEKVTDEDGGIAYGRHAAALGAEHEGAAIVCRSCGDEVVRSNRSWKFRLPSFKTPKFRS